MWKRIRYPLIGLALIALAVVFVDRMRIIRWVGSTHLTIEFVVTDLDTGQPIDGAEIVATEPEDPKAQPIRWKTDSAGVARWQGTRKCAGEQSGLRLTDTYSVHEPAWLLQLSAPGYQQHELTWLREIGGKARPRAVEIGPRQAKLVVPIPLRKAAP